MATFSLKMGQGSGVYSVLCCEPSFFMFFGPICWQGALSQRSLPARSTLNSTFWAMTFDLSSFFFSCFLRRPAPLLKRFWYHLGTIFEQIFIKTNTMNQLARFLLLTRSCNAVTVGLRARRHTNARCEYRRSIKVKMNELVNIASTGRSLSNCKERRSHPNKQKLIC